MNRLWYAHPGPFWKWLIRPGWFAGKLTGPDADLFCVDYAASNLMANILLSPSAITPLGAVIASWRKRRRLLKAGVIAHEPLGGWNWVAWVAPGVYVHHENAHMGILLDLAITAHIDTAYNNYFCGLMFRLDEYSSRLGKQALVKSLC